MEKTLRQFYRKYSELIFSFVFLIAAGIIFMVVTYPNVMTITSLHAEMDKEAEILATYQGSYAVLNDLNESKINADVSLATNALPAAKDPGSIYITVVNAATEANVNLLGFSVQVGDILGKEVPVTGDPQRIKVNVTLSNMDGNSFAVFTNALLSKFPISTISEANITSGQGDIDIDFYYMPYNLSEINAEAITPLNAQEEQILNGLN